jgi:hypothetical protein
MDVVAKARAFCSCCVRVKRASEPETVVVEVAHVRNQAPRPEDAWGSGSITPRVLNLGNRRA